MSFLSRVLVLAISPFFVGERVSWLLVSLYTRDRNEKSHVAEKASKVVDQKSQEGIDSDLKRIVEWAKRQTKDREGAFLCYTTKPESKYTRIQWISPLFWLVYKPFFDSAAGSTSTSLSDPNSLSGDEPIAP